MKILPASRIQRHNEHWFKINALFLRATEYKIDQLLGLMFI